MKLRYPLYLKILTWFFLNLILLGLGFYWFFRVQLGMGLESLFISRAGDHVQIITEDIAYELRGIPSSLWDDVLPEFEEEYGLEFYLFTPRAEQLAGRDIVLPQEVVERLERPRPGDIRRNGHPPPEVELSGNQIEPRRPRPRPSPIFMVRTSAPTRYWVGVRIPGEERRRTGHPPLTLIIASDSLSGGGHFIDVTPWILLSLGGVLLSILFWVPLVTNITRSVSQMSRATDRIASGRFDVALPTTRSDELGLLGNRINQMSGRLRGFVTGQKRFLGDIAHELCSPLARAQMALGILDQKTDETQKAYVKDVQEEFEQMSDLVNDLLSFSKSGMKSPDVQLETLQLAALVTPLIRRELPDSSTVNIQLPEELQVKADKALLSRAIGNVLRNAAHYALESGPIEIEAKSVGDKVRLSIRDHGPGVPPAALDQLFDPFFRLEEARSRDTGGVGLGLAIVKNAITACDGTVTARNCEPQGLEIQLTLNVA